MQRLSIFSFLALAAITQAAPNLNEKPPKWEYAELSYRTSPGRPGGVDANGNEIPATPATVTIKLISGTSEVDAKSWAELAEKLKAPSFKKDGSAAFLKIQFLNFLGSEGWELMEQTGSTSSTVAGFAREPGGRGVSSISSNSTWLLKRRVP